MSDRESVSAKAILAIRTLRRDRSTNIVDGTVTNTPSHAIYRDVPKIAPTAAAKHNQPIASRDVGYCKARKGPYTQRTMAKRP